MKGANGPHLTGDVQVDRNERFSGTAAAGAITAASAWEASYQTHLAVEIISRGCGAIFRKEIEMKFDLGGVGRDGPYRTVNLVGDCDIRRDLLDLDALVADGVAEAFRLVHTLEHVPTVQFDGFLRHLRRKLRPGGRVEVVQTDAEGAIRLWQAGDLSWRAMKATIFPPAARLAANPLMEHRGMWSAADMVAEFAARGFVASTFDAGHWPFDLVDDLNPDAFEPDQGVPVPNLGVVALRPEGP
jgi:hypothetical protein